MIVEKDVKNKSAKKGSENLSSAPAQGKIVKYKNIYLILVLAASSYSHLSLLPWHLGLYATQRFLALSPISSNFLSYFSLLDLIFAREHLN